MIRGRLMNQIEEFHGELMAGTAGDRIVELAACWAIILIVTGAFLWWPRKKDKIKSVLIPRFSKGKNVLAQTFCGTGLLDFSRYAFSRTNRPSMVRTVGQSRFSKSPQTQALGTLRLFE